MIYSTLFQLFKAISLNHNCNNLTILYLDLDYSDKSFKMLEILRLASPRERFLCLIVIIVLCWSVIFCADEYQVTQNAREVFSKRRKVFFSDKIEIIGSTYSLNPLSLDDTQFSHFSFQHPILRSMQRKSLLMKKRKKSMLPLMLTENELEPSATDASSKGM